MVQPIISKLYYFIFFDTIFSLSIYSLRVSEVFIFKFIKSKVSHNSHIFESNFIHQYIIIIYQSFWLYKIALKFSGDIEESTGPKPNSNQRFFICHWNLNSISAHNYINIFLLITYTFTHKFDVICFHETYLESDTSDDNDNLKTAGYNSV